MSINGQLNAKWGFNKRNIKGESNIKRKVEQQAKSRIVGGEHNCQCTKQIIKNKNTKHDYKIQGQQQENKNIRIIDNVKYKHKPMVFY